MSKSKEEDSYSYESDSQEIDEEEEIQTKNKSNTKLKSKEKAETTKSSQSLIPYSKKNIFLYDKKCRTVLQMGVLYRNLSKSATNSINLDKITHKIQSMIDKNQIYLRDVGPIILGITKIVVKKTFFLYKDIEELTNLRLNNNSKKDLQQDNSEIKTKERKGNLSSTINKKKLLKDKEEKSDDDIDIKNEVEGENTLAMNINSMETDVLNYQNSLTGFNGSALRNKKGTGNNNKYNELTFSKDIIELTNDDMIRRTIQKMKKLGESDIKEIITTNKKNNNKNKSNSIIKTDNIKYETENKNSKTIKNLKNINDLNDIDNSVNLDDNNKDVDNFFTVVKSQITTNQDNINDNNKDGNINEINFDFDINMNDLKDDYNLYSDKKYKINKEEFKNNLKTKPSKKSEYMSRNAKLKYDDELEIELLIDNEDTTKDSKNDEELEKELQQENRYKLKDIQINNTFYIFDKNNLTSFNNEKYEYLLPQFLEAKDTIDEENNDNNKNKEKMDSYLRKDNDDEQSLTSNTKTNIKNINSINSNDISRAERFTSSNKKKLSLGNFDSNNILMNNLSKLTLDKSDFKGAKSFIEKIADIDKENKTEEKIENDLNREDLNINSNFNNDINNDFDENDNNYISNMNIKLEKENKLSDDKKEEEDANLLKDDLVKNVFSGKNKKGISFDKIRNKLDNRDKFEEPKLFYDLLLLAQNGDINMTQNDLMKNKSINISLN